MNHRQHRRDGVGPRPPHNQFKAWLDTRGRLNPPGMGNRLARKCQQRWIRQSSRRNQCPVVQVGTHFLNTSGRTIRAGEMVYLTAQGTVEGMTAPPPRGVLAGPQSATETLCESSRVCAAGITPVKPAPAQTAWIMQALTFAPVHLEAVPKEFDPDDNY